MRVPYKIFLVDGIPLFDEVPAGARYSKGYEGRFWTPRPVSNEDILEELFRIFNLACPVDYAGRPLSCGDVVQIEDTFYRCQSCGWKELNDAPYGVLEFAI
jgi:hypothetical protein